MSDHNQNELKPCPFCGSVKLVPGTVSNTGGNIHFTRCLKCQAHGPWFDRGLKQTNPWNKRAEISVPDGKEDSGKKEATPARVEVLGQNELNEKVHELLGWKLFDNPGRMLATGQPRVWVRGEGKDEDSEVCYSIPQYCRDLNACHEFEKILEDDPNNDARYWLRLYGILDNDDEGNPIDGPPNGHWCDLKKVGHATAEQRCRAFIATMARDDVREASAAKGLANADDSFPNNSSGGRA